MQDLAHQDTQSAAGQPEASGPVPDTGEDAPALHAASAGNGAAVEVFPPLPRPAGRPKGSLNKATKEVRQVAGKYTLRACRKLWRLANEGKTEDIQLRATVELLDRGHGRPSQTQLVGGTGGGPLLIDFLRTLPE